MFYTVYEGLKVYFISDLKYFKMGLNGLVPAGVVTGDNLIKLFDYCKKNGHALPGKNS